MSWHEHLVDSESETNYQLGKQGEGPGYQSLEKKSCQTVQIKPRWLGLQGSICPFQKLDSKVENGHRKPILKIVSLGLKGMSFGNR
jgi:hypothetical protein